MGDARHGRWTARDSRDGAGSGPRRDLLRMRLVELAGITARRRGRRGVLVRPASEALGERVAVGRGRARGARRGAVPRAGASASWAYCEREDDLLVRARPARRAALGRAVRADAVHRRRGRPGGAAFELATLHLHTAAAATDARIPGPRGRRGGAAARPARDARRGPGGGAVSAPVAGSSRAGTGCTRSRRSSAPGAAAIALAVVLVPALVSGRDFFGSLVERRDPRRRRADRVRLVARHALAGREPGAAHRDRAGPPQLAALPARAGAGDRRDRAGPRPHLRPRRAAPAHGRRHRRQRPPRLRPARARRRACGRACSRSPGRGRPRSPRRRRPTSSC